MFIKLKSWTHYLSYLLAHRPKLAIGTALTLLSLVTTLLTLSDAQMDVLTVLAILGTIAGAVLTMLDIGQLRKEVEDIHISTDFNNAVIESMATKESLVKIGDRHYLIDEAVNAQIVRGALKKPVKRDSAYKLCADAQDFKGITAFALLSYFRSGTFHSKTAFRSVIPVWNDKKVRLETSPNQMAVADAIAIRATNYFDYISAGFFCLRTIELKGVPTVIGNEFIVGRGQPDGKWTVADLAEARTAHHIGINLVLTDRHQRLLYQKKNLSPGKVGNCAPSGSGSLDLQDLRDDSFEASIIAGALREFREETGWDKVITTPEFKSEKFTCRPIGMSVDLTRGLVTDFFVHAHTDGSIKEFIGTSKGKNHHDSFEIGKNSIDFFDLALLNNKSPTEVLDELLRTPDVISSAMLSIALCLLKSAALTDVEIGKQLGVSN